MLYRCIVANWITAVVVALATAGQAAEETIPDLLNLTVDAAERLKSAREKGLLEIAAVSLPASSSADCNHLGWPIATMVDDSIVVMHRRIPGHNPSGAGKPDPSMSYGIVLRSTDGGESWSDPYDLRDCMLPEDRVRGGIVPLSHRAKFDKSNKSPLGYKVHLHSIGTTRDNGVVAINNHGVFRSDDAGRSWQHFSTALRDDTFHHQIVNLGPRLVDHPQNGLMAFGNWFGEVDSYHKLSNHLVALSSPDGGATWGVEAHDVGLPQYEPAAVLHDDRMLFVTRDQTKVRAHKQMSWTPGESPKVLNTNLKDPRLVDTVDFSFNPVTKRFEIVRSERHHMELWLWSLDPNDWDSGQWRRECRLLATEGNFYSTADGFHPAGAVVDTERGVQHIFVYAGHPNGPAGVFRITRTLDTPKLVADLARPGAVVPLPKPFTKGGVVLTFDDRNFGDWVSALSLFDEFGAKATFFISGQIDNSARDAINQLTRHGHAIGSHSVHHLKAVEFCDERSPEEFVRLEIQPQMEAFRSIGLVPSSFAYPMSRNNSQTDEALLKEFRHLRTGMKIGPGTKISETDAFFVPASKMKEHGCLFGKGIDHAGERPDRTFEQLDAALARAAANQEIIVLYAHQISETANGNVITPAALCRVLSKVNALKLQYYTFDELP